MCVVEVCVLVFDDVGYCCWVECCEIYCVLCVVLCCFCCLYCFVGWYVCGEWFVDCFGYMLVYCCVWFVYELVECIVIEVCVFGNWIG